MPAVGSETGSVNPGSPPGGRGGGRRAAGGGRRADPV